MTSWRLAWKAEPAALVAASSLRPDLLSHLSRKALESWGGDRLSLGRGEILVPAG